MKITKEQAEQLVDNGTLQLDDGRVLRFREDADNDTTINDYDYLGKVAPIGRREYQPTRPEGFDGMAEKISTQGDTFWWQPPDDLRKGWLDNPLRATLRQSVQDILNYGYQVFIVELCHGTDGYGKPIVVDYGTLGGIEPFMGDDDKADYLMDIVFEINERQVA